MLRCWAKVNKALTNLDKYFVYLTSTFNFINVKQESLESYWTRLSRAPNTVNQRRVRWIDLWSILVFTGMLMSAVQCHKWVMAIFGPAVSEILRTCSSWSIGMRMLPRTNSYAIYLIDSFLSWLCHCQITLSKTTPY